jgi:GNAT superfamily N-acetyltransferase
MVTIRKARPSDIPRILELYHQLSITTASAELNIQVSDEYYRAILDRINNFTGMSLMVAVDGGEVVGTLVLVIVPNLAHLGLPWAVVENVIVDESRRRSGIGRLMMEYAVAEAKKAGCYRISLDSNNVRKEAHKFYESLGFKGSSIGFRMSL